MIKIELQNNIVVNTIVVDPTNTPDWCADWETLDEAAPVGIHSEKLSDGTWLSPEQRPTYMEPRHRKRRDALLVEMDDIVANPLRWAALSATEQTDWATYRQALLDVPQQVGFPLDVTWPTKPE